MTFTLFINREDRTVESCQIISEISYISYRPTSCDCSSNATGSSTGTGGSCLCGALGSSSATPEDVIAPDHSSASSKETMLSSNAQFISISALTVSPDGVLNVADQGSLHILALEHYLPTHDENGEFRYVYLTLSNQFILLIFSL
jgi:hypothetical protein